MKSLSSRIGKIHASQTVVIDSRYKQMLAEGQDVLSLGAGEPDLPTPGVAIDAAIQSLRDGLTRYTPVTGIGALREAVASKFKEENGIDCNADGVLITSGAKHAVFNALLALIEDGDEVIIPAPYWTTYPELVRFLGGVAVIAQTTLADGFKITAERLEALVTSRTKLVILNSPSNPTGAAYRADELIAIGEVVLRHDLYVLSDEIYEHITYHGFKHTSFAALAPELNQRTATVNGMSKSFAMTGMRLGYVTAPDPWLKAMTAIHSHGTHHPANASQYAALACLTQGADFLPVMRQHFEDARRFCFERLFTLPQLKPFSPQGAFYAFCDVTATLGLTSETGTKIQNSFDLSQYLLEAKKLATVPGSAFGREGWLRLSFANSTDYLDRALSRLASGLKDLN
jgi:aspartate aminotransferase